MRKHLTVAQFVEEVKTSSSKWLNTQSIALKHFSWQRGYGAFSVSPYLLDGLLQYVDHQEEYRAFLKQYSIEFDEKYVWD